MRKEDAARAERQLDGSVGVKHRQNKTPRSSAARSKASLARPPATGGGILSFYSPNLPGKDAIGFVASASDPYGITILETKGGLSLTKRHIRHADGRIETTPYGRAKYFGAARAYLYDQAAIVTLLSNGGHNHAAIRAEPRGDDNLDSVVRRIHDRDGVEAPFVDVPRQWAMLDFDGIAAPATLDLSDPEACGHYLAVMLPGQFLAAGWVFKFSSSHLVGDEKARKISGHLWVHFNRPVWGHELKAWLAPCIKKPGEDPSVERPLDGATFSAAQIHYIATPQFVGMEDPCPNRIHMHEGSPVEVDEEAVKAELPRQQRGRLERVRDRLLDGSKVGYPTTAQLLRAAISYIPPDDYHVWLEIGMALKIADVVTEDGHVDDRFDAYGLWLEWSQGVLGEISETDANFKDAEDCASKWQTFADEPGEHLVGVGRLFALAREHGYKGLTWPPAQSLALLLRNHPDLTEDLSYKDPKLAAVLDLNGRYAYITGGPNTGKVADLSNPAEPVILQADNLHKAYANQKIWPKSSGEETKPKPVVKSKVWEGHKLRREIKGVAFEPTGSKRPMPDGFHNIWQGFAVDPKPGDAHLPLLDHLLENVCHGSADVCHWLTAWLADMVQQPGDKPGTSVALRGVPGAGKSIIGEYMGYILGPHSIGVSNPKHVTGQFNAHLSSLILLRPEEAFWAGSHEAESVLKDLITSSTMMMEAKYANPIVFSNHVRLLATSNADWVVPAGLGDRRWAVFDVKPDRANDRKYWRPIQKAKDGDGPANLLHFLLGYDYDKEILRRPPKTRARLDQMMRSLDSIPAFWHSVLSEGDLTAFEVAGHQVTNWPFGSEVEKATVYDAYALWHRRQRLRRPLDDKSPFWKRLRALTGDKLEERRSREHGRKAVVRFPPLEECRRAFASVLGYQAEDLFGTAPADDLDGIL